MSEISTSAAAAKLAMVEISAASAVIPAAWPIAQIVYFNQCDPETMMKAGFTWLGMYDAIDAGKRDLDDARESCTAEQWSGEDRNGFEGYADKYQMQLLATQIVSITVGTTVVTVSMMLLFLVIAYSITSTILAAFAAFIVVAGATVVGAPAAASALATANTIAVEAGVLLRGLEKMITVVSTGGAAAIGAAIAGNVGMRLGSGDMDVLKDLVQATVDGTDNVIAGFLSKYERDFVGHGIHSAGRHSAVPNGPGYLSYGATTQTLPAGTDDEGNLQYGPGGVVDNIWNRVAGGDAWNH